MAPPRNECKGMKVIENRCLRVNLDSTNGLISVLDKRIGFIWKQVFVKESDRMNEISVVSSDRNSVGIKFELVTSKTTEDIMLSMEIILPTEEADLLIELKGERDIELDGKLIFLPCPFMLEHGFLVIPHCEGLLYPIDDLSLDGIYFQVYSTAGLSMPWFGATDSSFGKGYIAIFETPNDAALKIVKNQKNCITAQPVWIPSKDRFGYPRKILYHFFHEGGYVAQAKYYRKYAISKGLFKTLREKEAENPNVSKLIGAPDVWIRGDLDKVKFCKEMKAAGVDKMLISNTHSPEEIRAINALGFLTSRYDNYRDVLPPHVKMGITGFEDVAESMLEDTFSADFPKDIIKRRDGSLELGWPARTDRGTIQMYVLCPIKALDYARHRIGRDIKKNRTARFIDTITAAPLNECWDPEHPLTRTQDREYRYKLLEYVKSRGLIVGAECGYDWAVPVVHYFEGMMSLGRYRLPDAGHEISKYIAPPPEYLKYQVGEYYRVPLFQLVYHDAVVTTWYWGDSSNRLPELWPKKDLFNILYGTVPLWVLDKRTYKKNKSRLIRSFQSVCKWAERVGYDEMINHEFLTDDHSVQRTRFSSNIEVIVNFSSQEFILPDGKKIPTLGFLIRERK